MSDGYPINDKQRCQDCREMPGACKCARGETESTVWSTPTPSR